LGKTTDHRPCSEELMVSDTDHTKTSPDPASTWGATPEAKEAWDAKHGKAARKAAAEADKENKK
jgi:hypothetical protein